MIAPDWFVDRLAARGVDFYTGVPDSLLKPFNTQLLYGLPPGSHVIAANEGAAVGIAIGHYLRTGRPAVVYLQNSGLGNVVNPLLSLADPGVYGIPMLIIVGWRGQPGVRDEPQHVTQGRLMAPVLDAMEVPWAVLPHDAAAAERCLDEMVTVAVDGERPAVLLVEKGTFGEARVGPAVSPSLVPSPSSRSLVPSPSSRSLGPSPALPSREEALIALADALGGEAIVVSTTGMLSRELFEHRERTGAGAGRDFLTVGGMGHASSIALGVAMRESTREVWCFDGDGALLMHMGSLAVIADHAPATYFHAVFNNGVHDSVGGQPTAINRVDVPGVARAAGFRHAETVPDLAALPEAVAKVRSVGGPALLELRVRPGNREDLGRPTRTPAQSKRAFMTAVRST